MWNPDSGGGIGEWKMGKRCPNHLRDIGEGEEKVLRVGERNWKVGESMVGGDSRRRRHHRVEMWPCSQSEQGEGRPEGARRRHAVRV